MSPGVIVGLTLAAVNLVVVGLGIWLQVRNWPKKGPWETPGLPRTDTERHDLTLSDPRACLKKDRVS